MNVFLLATLVCCIVALLVALRQFSRSGDRRVLWLTLLLLLWICFLVLQQLYTFDAEHPFRWSWQYDLHYLPMMFGALVALWVTLQWQTFAAPMVIDYHLEPSAYWRLIRPALGIGIFASLSIVLITFLAYFVSQRAIRNVIARENLALGRTIANLSIESSPSSTPSDIVRQIETNWRHTVPGLPSTYMCVVGKDGRLRYHSQRKDLVGSDVGQVEVDPRTQLKVKTLIDQKSEWSGANVNYRGFQQIVGYYYVPELDGLVAIHVPAANVDEAFRAAVLPWLVGMLMAGGVLVPTAMGLLYLSARQSTALALEHLAQSRDNERRYRAFFEQDTIGVALIDRLTRRVLQCNRRFAEIVDIPDDHLNRLTWDELWSYHRSEVAEDTSPDINPFEQTKPIEWEIDLTTSSGRYRRIRFSLGFLGESQEDSGLVFFANDWTASHLAQAGQQRLLDLLDATPDLVVLFDSQGTIKHANAAAKDRLLRNLPTGSRDERCVWELMPERAAELVRTVGLTTSRQFGHWIGEIELLEPSGRAFLTSFVVVCHASRGGDDLLWSFVARDITRELETRTALQESELRFRKLIEHAPEAVVLLDVASRRFTLVNPAAERLFGMTEKELLDTPFDSLSPPVQPDGRPTVEVQEDWVSQCLAGKTPVFEWHHWDRNHQIVPCEIRLLKLEIGDRTIIRGSLLDISDRIAAREQREWYTRQLEALRKIDQAILRATPLDDVVQQAVDELSGVLSFDAAGCLVQDAPGGPLSWLGPTSPAFASDNLVAAVGSFLDGADLDSTDAAVAPLAGSGLRAPLDRELEKLGFQSVIRAPLVAGGQVSGLLWFGCEESTCFDQRSLEVVQRVTNSLSIAIAQARLRTRLEQYTLELEQRVEERTIELQAANQDLEAYAHTVAHDLRAPLRAIFGFAQALREDFGHLFQDDSDEYLRYIESAARQMDQLIVDLLDYAKVGQARPTLQPIDLDHVVRHSLERLQPDIESSNASIHVAYPLGHVLGRQSILIQVVVNLVENAIKFVPDDRRPVVEIESERKDNMIRLSVQDNGIGIAPEYHERIFGVFERLHGVETYPGTGIGLAIVRRVIEILGGRFGTDSEPGQGSRFWIGLPPT